MLCFTEILAFISTRGLEGEEHPLWKPQVSNPRQATYTKAIFGTKFWYFLHFVDSASCNDSW